MKPLAIFLLRTSCYTIHFKKITRGNRINNSEILNKSSLKILRIKIFMILKMFLSFEEKNLIKILLAEDKLSELNFRSKSEEDNKIDISLDHKNP